MFFYLLYNSTLIEKELDEYNRSIKVLIYGCITYIILHAILFIGGEEALLYSLKIYFWLFLLLDGIVLFLMFNKKNNNNKNVFELLFGKKKKDKQFINNQTLNTIKNPNQIDKMNLNKSNTNNTNNTRKKVKFNLVKQYESSDSDSDSDSDIGTDIDIASFKESLIE